MKTNNFTLIAYAFAIGICGALHADEALDTYTNSIGMEFTLIPAGTFMMGEPESRAERFARRSAERKADLDARKKAVRSRGMLAGDNPVINELNARLLADEGLTNKHRGAMARPNELHKVTLTKPFLLSVHEVTNDQWLAVMGGQPRAGDGPNPVTSVTWFDAAKFCRTLSSLPDENAVSNFYRLPSEAEWEYGCRAGSSDRFSHGDSEVLLGGFSWFGDNSNGVIHGVGEKQPNAWGLYDMHGNVWEWCGDWFAAHPTVPVIDPMGPSKGVGRVVKGGAAASKANDVRSANRGEINPSFKDGLVGFRLVLIPLEAASPEAGE